MTVLYAIPTAVEFVGLLVAIAREQSEAFIYVTRYVHTMLIVLTGSGGKLRIQ